jgi:hypothetical protein
MDLAASNLALGKSQPIGRTTAARDYASLFRAAIQRRLPQDNELVIPISGGRDSRHILVELLVGQEVALERLIAELKGHAPSPNPVQSFYFWNRTRRAVALLPFGGSERFSGSRSIPGSRSV